MRHMSIPKSLLKQLKNAKKEAKQVEEIREYFDALALDPDTQEINYEVSNSNTFRAAVFRHATTFSHKGKVYLIKSVDEVLSPDEEEKVLMDPWANKPATDTPAGAALQQVPSDRLEILGLALVLFRNDFGDLGLGERMRLLDALINCDDVFDLPEFKYLKPLLLNATRDQKEQARRALYQTPTPPPSVPTSEPQQPRHEPIEIKEGDRPEKSLQRFLLSAFSPAELQGLVRYTDLDWVNKQMPSPHHTPAERYFFTLVGLLGRYGNTYQLFPLLRKARPGHLGEIAQLEPHWPAPTQSTHTAYNNYGQVGVIGEGSVAQNITITNHFK